MISFLVEGIISVVIVRVVVVVVGVDAILLVVVIRGVLIVVLVDAIEVVVVVIVDAEVVFFNNVSFSFEFSC